MTGKLLTTMFAAGLLFASTGALAHCDLIDGPVAKVAQTALEDGNVNPVLAYAPAAAEDEIRAAFERSRRVRSLGGDASDLADHTFLETVISASSRRGRCRLHWT